MIIIEAAVKIIAYLLIFVGIWLLSYPFWIDTYRLQVQKSRLRRHRYGVDSYQVITNRKYNPLNEHIRNLIFSLSKERHEYKIWSFYVISVSLFIITISLLVLLGEKTLLSFILALIIGLIPYGYYQFRLINTRLKASLAFMKEYHIFMQLYQNYKDVYLGVKEATQKIRDRRLRMAFRRVLSSLEKDRTEKSFEEVMHLFAYTVGSSFANRFANLLIKAYRDNVDISEALFDLNIDLRKREKDMATLKTKRTETIILGFLPLAILPLFIWVIYKVFMMYSTTFVLEQKNIFTGFIISFILAIVSALSSYLLSKPRADL